jgi:general L-amino acid transport system permease protein
MAVDARLAPRPAPASDTPVGIWAWLRRNLFNGPASTALTIVIGIVAVLVVPDLFAWAIADSVWSTADPARCREAAGACWAVIAEKHRVILFGTYPFDQQWRGVLVVAIIVGLLLASSFRALWSRWLIAAWLVATAAVLIVQRGGVLGLEEVPTTHWGGLPLTLMLFLGTVVAGTPLAIALALGRRSDLPIIKALSVTFIEVVRGVPLVNVLFAASLMFPLFMPESFNLDKLLRAQLGMIIFYAAYTAEAVRGGLQAIPRGQYEAADALGVSYWSRTRWIILPQALRIATAPLVNDIIRAFKNTSVLSVIGLFDILGGTMAALEDPSWSRYYLEAYLFVALLYFGFCFTMSQYSQKLERDAMLGRNY